MSFSLLIDNKILSENQNTVELEDTINFYLEILRFKNNLLYNTYINKEDNKIFITGVPKNQITCYPKLLNILEIVKN